VAAARLIRGVAGVVLLVAGVALAIAVVVPIAYVAVIAVAIPVLVLVGVTRLAYWLVARLLAYGFPESAGPQHRWRPWAIWLVALAAGAAAGGLAVAAQAFWHAYAAAVTAPVGKALSPVLGPHATWFTDEAKDIVNWVATSGQGWRRPLLALALLAAWIVSRRHEAEAVRIATIDASPAR